MTSVGFIGGASVSEPGSVDHYMDLRSDVLIRSLRVNAGIFDSIEKLNAERTVKPIIYGLTNFPSHLFTLVMVAKALDASVKK